MKFNKLIPELSVSNITISKDFYTNHFGFQIAYERAEEKFVFLSLGEVQIMLEEKNDHWKTGELEKPFGRGINFQIEINDPELLANELKSKKIELFRDISRDIYKTPNGDEEQIEFLIQDPDGYLFRFCN